MLAELEAIPKPAEAFRWSLGCVWVVIREFLVSALLGARRAGAEWWNREEGVPMRNASIAAVVVLAVAVGFMVTPSFHEGMALAGNSVIGRSEDFGWTWPLLFQRSGVAAQLSPATERRLDQLRQEGEQHRDGKLLAYVALVDRRREVVQEAAERAVALDPQWTWVYYFVVQRFPKLPTAPRMIAALHRWDSDNAVVYLAEADRLAQLRWRPFSHGEIPAAVEEPWAATARAFDASKYDSYLRQQFHLKVELARQRGVGNTPLFASSVLGGSLFTPPPGIAAPLYADFVLRQAASPAEATAQARRVATFGERMMTGYSDRERQLGQEIALKGYEKLDTLTSGAEQTFVTARIAQLHSLDYNFGASGPTEIVAFAFRSNALLLMVCFSFMLVAAVGMLGAGAVFVLARGKASPRMVRLLWTAAGVMLVSCAAGYFASRPYADVLTRILSPSASVKEAPALWAFHTFPLLNPFVTVGFLGLLLLTSAIIVREAQRVRRRSA
jgi:hypothetical protein